MGEEIFQPEIARRGSRLITHDHVAAAARFLVVNVELLRQALLPEGDPIFVHDQVNGARRAEFLERGVCVDEREWLIEIEAVAVYR